jgi:hypothetical protein
LKRQICSTRDVLRLSGLRLDPKPRTWHGSPTGAELPRAPPLLNLRQVQG